MRMLAAAMAAGMAALAAVGPARAQPPPIRLAAGSDCATNVHCIPGFKRVYGIDPTSQFTPLAAADAGVQALDDGLAEVAVAFSSNPQLSRPDIISLRDDRGMIADDHVVPILRRSLLRRHGRPLRRRLDLASRILSTLELRGLNQQVIDGRLPEAVGGEFADANGLGGPRARRPGPAIRLAYQEFDENRTLAYFYAEALRGAGYRVRVSGLGGLRAAAVRAMRRKQIDLWPDYSGSLLGHLGGSRLQRALRPLRAVALRRSPAQDRNGFAMKRDVARALGISALSDLTRYWPPASGDARSAARLAATDPRLGEQWAVAPGSVLELPGAWQLTQGEGITVAIVDSGARLEHTDLGPNVWTNFDEVPGNGVDDDQNGYVDDVHGVDLTSSQRGQDLGDGTGHGTHVAGIVAAAANAHGVVGIAPRAKLMIVKVLDAGGLGNTGGVAEGIRYAAANGARVINCSIGSNVRDPRMDEAVHAAGAANALVVASAGNDSRDIDTEPKYPAAIAAQNLLAVASTDPQTGRGISEFSNYGRLAVQVAAPGAFILSASHDGGWGFKSGTSMAAPMVSGVAALAASVNARISAVDLRAVLMQNATRSRLPVAAGYIDALRSVLAASHSAGHDTSQPPRLRVLSATRKGRRTKIQAAVLGSTAGIHRYRVRLGRTRAELMPRPSPFTVTLRRRGARVRVVALDANGRVLAAAQRKVIRLRKGKRSVGTGPPVGT
jgi:subtilisin family serine protease